MVLDNLVFGHEQAIIDPGVELVVGDVGDQELVRALFANHQFGAVIHFAAYAYVGESVTNPLKYYQNNTAEPIKLLQVMQEFGCKVFVFSSTCATYGVPDQLPITEATPQKPINPYGRSKLMVEWILADCGHRLGPAQRLPALFQCQRLLARRHDRRRPQPRNPSHPTRVDGRHRGN